MMKNLDVLFEPDERSKLVGNDVESVHRRLEQISLSGSAPKKVIELFETAKNLSLCAVFVYEFHPIAELIGFQTLELAVRLRAEKEGISTKNKGFKKLMDRALSEGWIVEDRMPNRRKIAGARVEHRKIIESIKVEESSNKGATVIEPPTKVEIDSEEREMKIVQPVCSAAISLRNGLAHGNLYLTPDSHRRLEVTAGLISQLFP